MVANAVVVYFVRYRRLITEPVGGPVVVAVTAIVVINDHGKVVAPGIRPERLQPVNKHVPW